MAEENSTRTVLVTGATGKQGGAVARGLIGKGFKVRVLARKAASPAAQALAALGAEVVEGDLDHAASVEKALAGVWGVFSVQGLESGIEREEPQGRLLAKLAREKGAQHFVYSSVGSAHRKTGVPHFESKWRIEEYVRELTFPSHTVLRPVFFMENLVSPWYLHGDRFSFCTKPDTAVQMIAVDDIGSYGVRAFEKPEEMNGQAIDIAGDAVTMAAAAELIGQRLGKKLEIVQVPMEQVRKHTADMASMFEWFEKVGYDVEIPGLEQKYGIKTMTLAEWANKHVHPA
ncbi:MAG: NmrA/HSCARG family protein [Candidatus Wallbacteria bacterium]|nr:NmrA/HSCARG family protein [Candidatus Wallbacteria bacterium]